jgi:hypothetical protein
MSDQVHETALVSDPHIGEANVETLALERGRMTSASTDAVESGRRTGPEGAPGATILCLCVFFYGTSNHSQTDTEKSGWVRRRKRVHERSGHSGQPHTLSPFTFSSRPSGKVWEEATQAQGGVADGGRCRGFGAETQMEGGG